MRQEHWPGANIGAINSGSGAMHVGTAIGQHNAGPVHRPDPGGGRPVRPADVGILTVLPVEMRAVVCLLGRMPGYRTHQLDNGIQAHEAHYPLAPDALHVVTLQMLDRGPRSTVVAFQHLRERYAPPIVLLVGVAGGIAPGVAIGDVVISDQVIYYDARRETADGPRRRGQSHAVPPVLLHRLNAFFQAHRSTIVHTARSSFRMHLGPIGSGDAVVTDRYSDVRRWLLDFNEKTLAVETEAAGVAQSFYEEACNDAGLRGWLTIRGISDLADTAMDTSYQQIASEHAVAVLERLLPFLRLIGTVVEPAG
jgi:adenosylhomocysteine nucleosidase